MRNWSRLICLFLAGGCAWSQSLNPQDPSPLRPGINHGTVSTGHGAQYWYFVGGPGDVRVTAHFMSHDGFAWPAELAVTLYDEQRTYHVSKVIKEENVDATFTGKPDKKQKTIISVAPPSGIALITSGGNYELEATGSVQFEEAKGTSDPIVRTFAANLPAVSGQNTNDYGATKFFPNGTVTTSNGLQGTWKPFDPEHHIYTVIIDGKRFSLQYIQGNGLVEVGHPNDIPLFKEVQ